jgi:hypothetical protein
MNGRAPVVSDINDPAFALAAVDAMRADMDEVRR